MENPLNQFEALSSKEKLSFKKEAMPPIAEILANDSPKMMAEMMPMSQQIIEVMQYGHAGHDARKESSKSHVQSKYPARNMLLRTR